MVHLDVDALFHVQPSSDVAMMSSPCHSDGNFHLSGNKMKLMFLAETQVPPPTKPTFYIGQIPSGQQFLALSAVNQRIFGLYLLKNRQIPVSNSQMHAVRGL